MMKKKSASVKDMAFVRYLLHRDLSMCDNLPVLPEPKIVGAGHEQQEGPVFRASLLVVFYTS